MGAPFLADGRRNAMRRRKIHAFYLMCHAEYQAECKPNSEFVNQEAQHHTLCRQNCNGDDKEYRKVKCLRHPELQLLDPRHRRDALVWIDAQRKILDEILHKHHLYRIDGVKQEYEQMLTAVAPIPALLRREPEKPPSLQIL